MSGVVNPITGDVSDEQREIGLVPLNLAELSEEAVIEMFPTPVQAAGALIRARQTAARAPRALSQYREALASAERALKVAIGMSVLQLKTDHPKSTLTERRILAEASEKVIAAREARDEAWLLLEYARDYDRAIGRDIDILRSLNANFRGEHK